MNIDDPAILALREKVLAAQQEFDQATAYHEAWKPAAYDTKLHDRLGSSYATGAFVVIRQALRREMLLALMRMWDAQSKALSLANIANSLRNPRVVDALAADLEQYWGHMEASVVAKMLSTTEAEALDAYQAGERKFARSQIEAMRAKIAEAITIIQQYEFDGSKYKAVEYLRQLRNQQLAHRQVRSSMPPPPDDADAAIESFYQDMAKVVRLLLTTVVGTDYRPDQTGDIRRRHAEMFWAGVRGERTEGHPKHRPLNREPPYAVSDEARFSDGTDDADPDPDPVPR